MEWNHQQAKKCNEEKFDLEKKKKNQNSKFSPGRGHQMQAKVEKQK